MVFAKSSDRPIEEPQVLSWLRPRPGVGDPVVATYRTLPAVGAVGVLGSQPTWMWGLEHGVNEHGVAIGNEKVWTTDDPHAAPPALLGMDLVRLGLERGATADEALEATVALLAEHGQGGSGEADHDEPYWSSFLIVDPAGGWVLETSDRSWVAQPVGDGAAISNRLTLSDQWTRSSADIEPGADWDTKRAPEAPTGIADHRLAATRRCVARGAVVTAADAVATLRDHGSGPWGRPGDPPSDPPPPPDDVRDDWSGVTVCMHVRGYQCTTASMVCDLPADPGAPLRVWASLGTPCTGVFLPVAMLRSGSRTDAIVPGVLGDVDAWRAFAELGRRVEAPGEAGSQALTAVRALLSPIEGHAWAEADDLWTSGSGPERWRSAAAGWDAAVRSALAALG
jgi:secernin